MMLDSTPLFETIGMGPAAIQTIIQNLAEEFNKLMGDRVSGTKYQNSYNQISSNTNAKRVLHTIANNVKSWTQSIRGYTSWDFQWRIVYLIASIIPAVAKRLYQLSKDPSLHNDKDVQRVFLHLMQNQYGVSTQNKYADLADMAYAAWLSALEIGIPTRQNTEVENDYNASRQFNDLLSATYEKVDDIRKLVWDIVDTAGVRDDVNIEEINAATRWVFLYDCIKNDLYGKEQVDAPWYSDLDSIADFVYKYTSNTLSNTKNVRAANKSSKKNMAIDTNTYVVKDMPTIGNDTEQMNMLNDRSLFTCECYFKIYTQTGMSSCQFTDDVGYYAYKIMYHMLRAVGINVIVAPVDVVSANKFSEFVKRMFKVRAISSTQDALRFRADLIAALSSYEDDIPTTLDDFIDWHERLYHKTPKEKSYAKIKEAIDKIRTEILYVGDASISGRTPNGTEIHAVALTVPVVTFGDSDTTDRNKQDDLNEAGKITKGCFNFQNDVLTISYDGNRMEEINHEADSKYAGQAASEVDNQYVIDIIPREQLQDIYGDYISSKLLPAIVSRTKAWIMLCGLKTFTKYMNGDLEDSIDTSAVNKEANRIISTSNVSKDTRISSSERSSMIFSSEAFIDGLISSKLMTSIDANNASSRMKFINKIKQLVTPELKQDFIKIHAACDAYTKAVSIYAEMQDVNMKTARSSVYTVTPSLGTIISGKQSAVDNIVLAVAHQKYTDQLDTVYNVNKIISKILNATELINKCKDNFRNNARKCLMALWKYISTVDDVLVLANRFDIFDKILDCIPPTYDEWHDGVIKLYDKMMSVDNPNAIANQNAEQILRILDQASMSDKTTLNQLKEHAQMLCKRVFDPDGEDSINDPSINALHSYLSKLSTMIERTGITGATLERVKVAIAKSMDGSLMSNLNNIDQLRINQLVLPVKVFITAANIAYPDDSSSAVDLTRDISELNHDRLVAFNDDNDAPMDEVTPFHDVNIGNAYLKTSRLNDENAIHSKTIYNDMPLNGDYLEKILDAAEQYEDAENVVDDAKNTINDAVDSVRELGLPEPNNAVDSKDPTKKITQEYQRNIAYINLLADAEQLDPSYTAYYMKCATKLASAQKVSYQRANQLDNISNRYPTFKGLINALLSASVSATDLKKAIKYIDIAAAQRNSMVKYRSYSAANVEDAGLLRQFAYTASDESTIAQIICVLGSFIAAPHMDSLADLVDSLTQVNRIVNQYSKNALSVKVTSKVLTTLSRINDNRPAEDDADQMDSYLTETASTIISLINQLGGFLLSRNTKDRNIELIERTNKIERPVVNDATYGSATDSFARAQLRNIPKGYTKDTIKHPDKEENAARQAYMSTVKQDLQNNPELAKFAYALGDAFNTFERMLTDERVSGVDASSLHSVQSSLSQLGLFKNLSTSDLQRELISAIIDDERNHDKDYPTVLQVVRAAQTGGSFAGYTQMYSAKVGSVDNILHDQKNEIIAFDENGNRTTPDNAVQLTNDTITRLATKVINPTNDKTMEAERVRVANLIPFTSIADLVHSVRMCVFEQLYRVYGSIDPTGYITYTKNYANTPNTLMDAAMRQLYHLCDDMDTPIADIILVSTSLGRKLARLVVMEQVRKRISDDDDIDFDYVGMISHEPNAYPQTISDEESEVDADWITKVSEILSFIPNSMSREDVLRAVEMYNMNDITRQKLARDDDGREFIRIIDKLLRLDTETGIPVGFWGEDSSDRKAHIKDIFNQVCAYKTDSSIPWDECAAQLRETFMNDIRNGGNQLNIGNVAISDAAKRRIGHLRLNPFYATNVRNHTADYRDMLRCLVTEGIITSYGRIVKTKYPNLSFDKHTFDYILNVALDLNSKYKLYVGTKKDSSSREDVLVSSFLTTLMLVTNEFRIGAYIQMRDAAVDFKHEHNDLAMKAYDAITYSQNIYTEPYDELIHISFGKWTNDKQWITDEVGWLTKEAYAVLCYYAAANVLHQDESQRSDIASIEQAFIDAYKKLSAGGNITTDVKLINRTPRSTQIDNSTPTPTKRGKGKTSKRGKGMVNGTTNDQVNSEQPELAQLGTPIPTKRGKGKTLKRGKVVVNGTNNPDQLDDEDEPYVAEVYSNVPELQGRYRHVDDTEPEDSAKSQYDDEWLRNIITQNSDLFDNPYKKSKKSAAKRSVLTDVTPDNVMDDD